MVGSNVQTRQEPDAAPARGVAPCEEKPVSDPRILVLTPVKDALRHLDRHFELLARLSYPADRISIGLLEGDSSDGTYDALEARLQDDLGVFVLLVVPVLVHFRPVLEAGMVRNQEGRIELPFLDHLQ